MMVSSAENPELPSFFNVVLFGVCSVPESGFPSWLTCCQKFCLSHFCLTSSCGFLVSNSLLTNMILYSQKISAKNILPSKAKISFNVSAAVLRTFCRSCIESVLPFSFLCWFGGLNVKSKNN